MKKIILIMMLVMSCTIFGSYFSEVEIGDDYVLLEIIDASGGFDGDYSMIWAFSDEDALRKKFDSTYKGYYSRGYKIKTVEDGYYHLEKGYNNFIIDTSTKGMLRFFSCNSIDGLQGLLEEEERQYNYLEKNNKFDAVYRK